MDLNEGYPDMDVYCIDDASLFCFQSKISATW